jgi:pimeloyl-ACP methyl ester carboxylesterase
MTQDVTSAIDFLLAPSSGRGHPFHSGNWNFPKVRTNQIFAVGYSVGGQVGLHAAALDRRLAGVASLSGFAPMRTNVEGSRGGGLRRDYELHQLQPRLGFFQADPTKLPYDYEDVIELIVGDFPDDPPRQVLVYAPKRDRAHDHTEVARCIARVRHKLGLTDDSGPGAVLSFVEDETVNMLDEPSQLAVLSWLKNATDRNTLHV